MDLEKKQYTEIVPFEKLAKDDQQKALSIKERIQYKDTQAVLQFGVSAQSQIAQFSDSVLQQIRNKDAGHAGNILGDLLLRIKDLKIDSLSPRSNIGKIPFIGSLINSIRRFITKYEKLSIQIEKIIDELDKARMQLLKDITLLDSLYEKNYEYLKELDLFIAAGQLLLKDFENAIIPDMQAKAKETNDPVDAQKLQDMNQMRVRFEKKLYDLKLSRMISIQAAPQIRLIQNNDQVLVEKIQTSILSTIPLWKNQIVIAITIFRQKKALDLQKEVSKTTNELLMKNSELLKNNTTQIMEESERGIVEIETLKKVNSDLITIIEDTLRIQKEGHEKRVIAESELVKMENELKEKLKSIKSNQV